MEIQTGAGRAQGAASLDHQRLRVRKELIGNPYRVTIRATLPFLGTHRNGAADKLGPGNM